MELKNLSKEELREYSFIEISHHLLVDRHATMTFNEMLGEWKKLLGLTDKELKARMVQFYTDLNMDGRFISIGEDQWGLRTWYPLDQVEDEHVTSEIQTKKKSKAKSKKKKLADEDLDFDDLDDEEDDLAYDELDEDIEDIDDLDDDDEDEDFDEELIEDDDFDLDEDEEEEDEDEDLEDEEDK
ncbi:DNA-directed RNA polymerase subunit delta [Jeotgalibacillus proteolyticus]|uniref:Probable DNA-directed RNA polymerase subunit delta n=1 Tax=Jeotgalibacillus proteolyticus TaxID=2082395 RepID=A0A2S5G9Q4_9BACL|nr:DNA-directed RNA polymerase subunit delta [Jeotgalibacillus proteolyticus]PPA69651.1 DNA-directed RNA polymerase subunit delta [Jeotgalibacillus proteolyticus]